MPLSRHYPPTPGLLSSKRAWLWGPEQESAFVKAKETSTKPTILALYRPGGEAKVAVDASSFGLRAVLLQRIASKWRPVAYASRALSAREQNYAQIEKEALAVTWASTKFSDYLLGSKFLIKSDHKTSDSSVEYQASGLFASSYPAFLLTAS